MKVFLCRWPGGDLSIVGARNREEAVFILDEFDDASDAELIESKSLLIDFKLDDNGHLELNNWGEDIYALIWEKAYPLIEQARMNSHDDEEDFPEAAKAERERLWPKEEPSATTHFARNLLVARLASEGNITLSAALEKTKAQKLIPTEPWQTIAAKCHPIIGKHFNDHLTTLHSPEANGVDKSVRMADTQERRVKPTKDDLLPHYLLAAAIAEHARGSILMTWPFVEPHLQDQIGNYWHWLAQEIRTLPLPS